MKKTSLILLIMCCCFASCKQEKRVEIIYQECLYNSLSDKGESLKRYAKGFEMHLIALNILKDSSAQSYYNIYKSIANGKHYPTHYKYSYIDSINKIEQYKINPNNKECLKYINSLEHYNDSKIAKINKVQFLLDEKESNNKFSEKVTKILPIMEVKDFELDYYKHKTFMFIYFSFLSKDLLLFNE